MENPGLKKHSSTEPFLKVVSRRTAATTAAYDPERQSWTYDLEEPNYFEEDPAPSARSFTHKKMMELKQNHPNYPEHWLDDENTVNPGDELFSDPYEEDEGSRAWIDSLPAYERAQQRMRSRSQERTAAPMVAPRTQGIGGNVVPPEPPTIQENIQTPPPLAGTPSAQPVSATNGANPILQLTDPNGGANRRRIDTQKQFGGGQKENRAYDEAQKRIRDQVQQRRAHPLHQATQNEEFDSYGPTEITPEERDNLSAVAVLQERRRNEGDNLKYFVDTDFRPDPSLDIGFTHQPMIDFKHVTPDHDFSEEMAEGADMDQPGAHEPGAGCETCWLKDKNPYSDVDYHDDDDHEFKPFSDGLSQRFSASSDESDEDFWARMEREHPGEQPSGITTGVTPDTTGLSYDHDGDVSDEDEDDVPDNMSLRDHSRLLNSGAMQWDGTTSYPRYTHNLSREIRDSDGNRAFADEGHVIEHNTNHHGPVLPTEDNPDPHVLQYPWSHTYYPAGMSDDEGLTKGYNTPDQALAATYQLSVWGARRPQSQELLKGYRYLGSEQPYDPSQQLPHEAAQTANQQRHEAGFKDDYKDAFTDFADWSGINPWYKGLKEQMKSLKHPDFYDEEGNLAQKGYEPQPVPARPTWKEIASKPRHVRPVNPGMREAAYDKARQQFLYDIHSGDPDYYLRKKPPSSWEATKQPMMKLKDDPYERELEIENPDGEVIVQRDSQPVEDSEGFMISRPLFDDGHYNHHDYQGCLGCLNRDLESKHPDDKIHKRRNPAYSYDHEYEPISDLAPGVRL